MGTIKITNDPRTTVRIANLLLDTAAGMLTEPNGHPLSAEQEARNDEAEIIVEYANELRERHGKPPLAVAPRPVADAEGGWTT